MTFLYSEDLFSRLSAQLRRRRILFWGYCLLCLSILIWLLSLDDHKEHRPDMAVMLLLIFSVSGIVFYLDILVRPLKAYARHLDFSLHGRARETTLVFDRVQPDISVVDGVSFRELIFLGEADKHGDRERMLYWDSSCSLPDFTRGQEMTLRYYDRFITAYRV